MCSERSQLFYVFNFQQSFCSNIHNLNITFFIEGQETNPNVLNNSSKVLLSVHARQNKLYFSLKLYKCIGMFIGYFPVPPPLEARDELTGIFFSLKLSPLEKKGVRKAQTFIYFIQVD